MHVGYFVEVSGTIRHTPMYYEVVPLRRCPLQARDKNGRERGNGHVGPARCIHIWYGAVSIELYEAVEEDEVSVEGDVEHCGC